MAPPAFGLTAEPIQRMPDVASIGQTDYKFDTGRITGADLQDPSVIERLESMTVQGLEMYLKLVTDSEVAGYVQGLIAQHKAASVPVAVPPVAATPAAAPAAAAITDTRDHVLATQRQMYDDLTAYLQGLPARMKAMVANPPANSADLQNNPNVDAVIAMTEQLAADFTAETHIVRFDASLVGTSVAASYSFTEDIINLRPFSNDGERGDVVASLLHEFTHQQQDVVVEAAVRTGKTSDDHDLQDELDHEVGGRKSGVYASAILRGMGEIQQDFNSELSDRVFLGMFEDERKAKTPKAKAAATKAIRTKVEGGYTSQIANNVPSATHYAELTADNHIHLKVAGVDHDLGAVPANTTDRDALHSWIEAQIRADAKQFGAFTKGKGNYSVVTVLIFSGDRKLGEFAMNPVVAAPAAVVPAAQP